MLMMMFMAAAGLAQAQAAAPLAAPAGRGLHDLPNTTIAYYDVAGHDGAAIAKSLKLVPIDPVTKAPVRLYTWDVGAQIGKKTTGTVCTIENAKATLTSTVHLPRLTEEARLDKDTATRWHTYMTGVETEIASNLWFVRDRLPTVEQSLVGLSCDQAAPKWEAGIGGIKTQLAAFIAEHAKTAPKSKR